MFYYTLEFFFARVNYVMYIHIDLVIVLRR